MRARRQFIQHNPQGEDVTCARERAPRAPVRATYNGECPQATHRAPRQYPGPIYGVFASADQVNFLIPAGTTPGVAIVAITVPAAERSLP